MYLHNSKSTFFDMLAALAQRVACLPLVQRVGGSMPSGVEKFSFENFQPREIVHHSPGLNSKPFRSMHVEKTYSTVDSDSYVGWGR